MGKQDSIFEITQKVTMSQKIVKKDPEFGYYAGADISTSMQIAKLRTIKELGLIPKKFFPVIDFYLSFLDHKRKAFFGSFCTELTKLGLILGDERKHKSASSKRK